MERKDVETKYRWKIEDVFESDEAWERAFAELETLPDFSAFRGKLNTAENVAAFFATAEEYEKSSCSSICMLIPSMTRISA